MPALASPLCTSCFINGTDSASLQSGLLANTSPWRPAKYFVQSTNIHGHLLFSGNKGLSNIVLLVQETLLKPVWMEEKNLSGKRTNSRENSGIKTHLIACWAQRAANWLDTFRGEYISKSRYSLSRRVLFICVFFKDSGQSQYGMKKILYECLSKLCCLLWLQQNCLEGTWARETQGAILIKSPTEGDWGENAFISQTSVSGARVKMQAKNTAV